MWHARTRIVEGLDEPLGLHEAISAEEALRLYTTSAAYASFAEHERGVLKPGMLADWVALSVDPLTADPEELRTARVLETAVGGRVVHADA